MDARYDNQAKRTVREAIERGSLRLSQDEITKRAQEAVTFARDNATERVSVSVPSGTNNGMFTLTFPTIPSSTAPGRTYARFRLSTDPAAADSIGCRLAILGHMHDGRR